MYDAKQIVSTAGPTQNALIALYEAQDAACTVLSVNDVPQQACFSGEQDFSQVQVAPIQADLDRLLNSLNLAETVNFFLGSRVHFLLGTNGITNGSKGEGKPECFFEGSPTSYTVEGPIAPGQNPPNLFSLKPEGKAAVYIGYAGSNRALVPNFLLALSRNGNNPNALARTVSFFPMDKDGVIVGFGELPLSKQQSPGLDGVTMVIESLSVKSRDELLEQSAFSRATCCIGGEYKSIERAVCEKSKYAAPEKGGYPSKDCDDFMADQWCKSPIPPERADTCGCFDNAPIANVVQRLIVEKMASINNPIQRKCIVAECKQGSGYQTRKMQNAPPCESLCIQVQAVIDEGGLSNIDFGGEQRMVCNGKPLQPPPFKPKKS